MALMGLVCLGFSLYFAGQEVLLAATGHSTTGTVTEKSTSYDNDNNTTSYYLSYSYEDDNHQTYTSKSDVSKDMYDSNVEGSSIPVVYSSSSPTISRVRAAGAGLLPAGMFVLMGVPILWFGLRTLLRQIYWDNKLARLKTKGDRYVGKLVGTEENKSEQNEDYTPLALVYTFTDKTGQERTGKTHYVKPKDQDFWKGRIGCPLEVRANPVDPADHIALIEESKLLT